MAAARFGARAEPYVRSAVHAAGEDLDRLAARPGDTVLDLGTGGGHVAYRAAAHAGRVIACDVAGPMLAAVAAGAASRGPTNIETVVGDASRLPLPDNHVDVLASRYSAHRWPDLPAAMREAARVLRPGGHALFCDAGAADTDLADNFLQTPEMLRDPSHVRDRGAAEWLAALAQAGFRVGDLHRRAVRMEMGPWLARGGCDGPRAAAIAALQRGAAPAVRAALAFEPDGGFVPPTLWIEAAAA